MHAVLVLAIALLGNAPPSFPAGSYAPDFSQTSGKGGRALKDYFGKTYLLLSGSGDYYLCGPNQIGVWREQGGKIVVVFDGRGNDISPQPRATQRKTWPRDQRSGMFLRRGANRTLVLESWGPHVGLVIFRPMPKRSVTQLLLVKEGIDSTPKGLEALAALRIQKQTQWPEMLQFINDPKRTGDQRSWGAIVLTGITDPNGINAAAKLIFALKPASTREKTEMIRMGLADVVAAAPTEIAVDLLIKAQAKGLVRASSVAPAMGKLARPKDAAQLVAWLTSKDEFDKIEALRALMKSEGAADGLPAARRLINDPEPMVQVWAYGLIARATTEPTERQNVINALGAWTTEFRGLESFFAMEALCDSKVREAVPYLNSILSSNTPPRFRRNTAVALGKLADARSIPALRYARARREGRGEKAQELEVNRAAAEALLLFEKAELK